MALSRIELFQICIFHFLRKHAKDSNARIFGAVMGQLWYNYGFV